MRKAPITEEQKVASMISKSVSDLRLDLEMVGFYLAYYLPNVAFRRFMVVAESAEHQKNGIDKKIEVR